MDMDNSRSRPLVLIVDDDSTMRLLSQAILARAGFEVAGADDGQQCLEAFKSLRPDLVLMDVLMTGMDGFSTCAALRRLPGGDHTPILMVTGLDDLDSINRAYEVGATDFITKPVNWTILSSRVRYMVRASQTYAELRRSQSRLAHAQDIARLGYWEWHLETDKILWSEEIPRLLGVAEQEFAGGLTAILGCLHPDDRDRVAQAINTARRQGSSFSLDSRLILPDAAERIVNLQGEASLDDAGRLFLITGTVQDITERKKTEEALRESKNFLEGVFDAIPDGIMIIDPNLNVIRFNKGAESFFDPQFSPVGQKCYTVIQQRHDPCPHCPALKTLETREGCIWIMAFPGQTKSGGWMEASTYPLQNAQGTITGVIAYMKDITARKKLEEQLLQAQKMEAVGRLAGGVAHDFNNMLTVIAGCSEFLFNRLDGQDELRHEVEEIQEVAERAASLTRQLLSFSRKQVLNPQILDLNTVVANIDKMLLRIIGEDINLITRLEPQLGLVKADPVQIGQVILNLAVNSRDAMPEGGSLTIETANVRVEGAEAGEPEDIPPGSYALLTISDTGTGIAPESQAHIFEPFFTTKDSDKGTGLGLSTVYGIISQSDGHIRLFSAAGRGATFKIYLPLVAAPSPHEGALTQPRPISLQGAETILLVEDEDLVREVTGRILERYGYAVLQANGGTEALRLVEGHCGPLHLLLTDVTMPGMSGRELAESLVARHPRLKVLYMSGYAENAIGERGILHPKINFLQKPFKHYELALKIREVLDARDDDQTR
jgi:PAS domain S-box-containing protein